MLIKLVCLNLNRRDTRQQPVPAYSPANRADRKAASKRIYHCVYRVQQCVYISWNVCSHLCTEHELHSTQHTGLYIAHTCFYDWKRVHNSINMYIHVWSEQCTYTFIPQNVHTMYIQCIFMYIHLQKCIYMYVHVYDFQCLYIQCLSCCTIALYIECIYMV